MEQYLFLYHEDTFMLCLLPNLREYRTHNRIQAIEIKSMYLVTTFFKLFPNSVNRKCPEQVMYS
jgi:hypothetical protein